MNTVANAKLLIIDDDKYFGRVLQDLLDNNMFDIFLAESGNKGLALCQQEAMDIVLLDQKLPDIKGEVLLKRILSYNEFTKIILVTAYASFSKAVEAIKQGAYDYLPKPVDPDQLKLVLKRATEATIAEQRKHLMDYQRSLSQNSTVLLGVAECWQQVMKQVKIASKTSSPVLITGETGVGKSVVARYISDSCQDTNQPFVDVNCAAIPENLMESELFGHEKGAFTGAVKARPGLFELADGGILFLDEIGEIPIHMQAKLLGVLDSCRLRRVGGCVTRKISVRIIAASNVDIEKALAKGTFRKDLFYRLSVMRIHIPPLRERKEDIQALCEYFIRQFAGGKYIHPIDVNEMQSLMNYSWPGNVRELRNIIERAILMKEGDRIYPARFLSPKNLQQAISVSFTDNSVLTIEEVKKRHIIETFRRFDNNISRTAKALGVSRSTIQRFLQNCTTSTAS